MPRSKIFRFNLAPLVPTPCAGILKVGVTGGMTPAPDPKDSRGRPRAQDKVLDGNGPDGGGGLNSGPYRGLNLTSTSVRALFLSRTLSGARGRPRKSSAQDFGHPPSRTAPAPSGAASGGASSSSAPVLPPPVPVPRLHRPAGDVAAPRTSNRSWPVEGGWIVYDEARDSLDGHCGCALHKFPRNPCRVNRTRLGVLHAITPLTSETLKAQGRPLGLILCWLANCHKAGSRERHRDMLGGERRTEDDAELFSHANRLGARQAASINLALADVFALERPPRDGEGEEPLGEAGFR
jgi:hypothetical protein